MTMTPDRSRDTASSTPVKSLSLPALAEELAAMGQPRFRAKQVATWLYHRFARSYDEMTDLPVALRATLAARLPLETGRLVTRQDSADGTRKYLVEFSDGVSVETVGLPSGDRLTVCFSTQAGCAMGCSFCATGASGLTRDLTCGEMADQVNLVAEDFGRRVTNAVAMGQGEPFAVYDATLAALRILNSPDGLGIGARHITVSTCGLIPGIARFAEEPEQFTLAVSLHSATQATRDALMPGVRGARLDALRRALIDYGTRSGRRPSLEYALIDGVNDTDAEIAALVDFARGMLVHVNLIPINPVSGTHFAASPESRAQAFVARLAAAGVEVSVRTERGADIDAACGQLRQRTERP